jgi:hypothetical protein
MQGALQASTSALWCLELVQCRGIEAAQCPDETLGLFPSYGRHTKHGLFAVSASNPVLPWPFHSWANKKPTINVTRTSQHRLELTRSHLWLILNVDMLIEACFNVHVMVWDCPPTMITQQMSGQPIVSLILIPRFILTSSAVWEACACDAHQHRLISHIAPATAVQRQTW